MRKTYPKSHSRGSTVALTEIILPLLNIISSPGCNVTADYVISKYQNDLSFVYISGNFIIPSSISFVPSILNHVVNIQ